MSSRPSGLSVSDRFHFTSLSASTHALPRGGGAMTRQSRRPHRQPPRRAQGDRQPIRPHPQAKNAGPIPSGKVPFAITMLGSFFSGTLRPRSDRVCGLATPNPLGESLPLSCQSLPTQGWVDKTPGEARPLALGRRAPRDPGSARCKLEGMSPGDSQESGAMAAGGRAPVAGSCGPWVGPAGRVAAQPPRPRTWAVSLHQATSPRVTGG